MSAVQRIDETPRASMTPMDMLSQALSNGASVEQMSQLMSLQERWEATQARKAFDAALSAAKAEIPVIAKSAKGHNDKRYADFAAIARIVDPIISKHGLSYRFRTRQDEKIHVTCILSHEAGHHEETTLAGPSDTSGSKNAIQAIGSTLTYLQRYSLTQMLGLAASEDDDGAAAGTGMAGRRCITEQQVMDLRDLIESVGADERKLLAFIKVASLDDIAADQFDAVVKLINRKRGA